MSVDPSMATVVVFIVMWIALVAFGASLVSWYRGLPPEGERDFDLGL